MDNKSSEIDAERYLADYPDVANSGLDPLDHFLQFGFGEGRAAWTAAGIDLRRVAATVASGTEGAIDRQRLRDRLDALVARAAAGQRDEEARRALDRLIAGVERPRDREAAILGEMRPSLQPYRFFASEAAAPRITLLVPSLDDGAIYGGIRTALDFFFWLAGRLRKEAGVALRIVAQDSATFGAGITALAAAHGLSFAAAGDDGPAIVVSGAGRDAEALPLRRDEIFVTTFWATSHALHHATLPENGGAESWPAPRICHFLQDYEPNFYPASSARAFCEQSLASPRNGLYVANTSALAAYVGGRVALPAPCLPFTPTLDPRLRPLGGVAREDALLFYARRNPRNAFDIGRLALATLCRKHPDIAGRYRFVGVGDTTGTFEIGRDVRLTCLGKLSMDAYRAWLARARVGLSLMLAPHPSYPPLEMAYNGLRVVTNDFETRRMAGIHPNIAAAPEADPEAIADLLAAGIAAAEAGPPATALPFGSFMAGFEGTGDPFAPLAGQAPFAAFFAGLLRPGA